MRILLSFIILINLPLDNVQAEYRAFQYFIKSKTFTNTRVSTLNPVAFRAYHGGPQEIEINLLKTWMCPGYTGNFKAICPSPEKQLIEELKSAQNMGSKK